MRCVIRTDEGAGVQALLVVIRLHPGNAAVVNLEAKVRCELAMLLSTVNDILGAART